MVNELKRGTMLFHDSREVEKVYLDLFAWILLLLPR